MNALRLPPTGPAVFGPLLLKEAAAWDENVLAGPLVPIARATKDFCVPTPFSLEMTGRSIGWTGVVIGRRIGGSIGWTGIVIGRRIGGSIGWRGTFGIGRKIGGL